MILELIPVEEFEPPQKMGPWIARGPRPYYGPEYISAAMITWGRKHEIKLDYIQPGNPQQNAFIERYNRKVRYDWLNQYLWKTIRQVQQYATQWMWLYNHKRPNMALGGVKPKQQLAMTA